MSNFNKFVDPAKALDENPFKCNGYAYPYCAMRYKSMTPQQIDAITLTVNQQRIVMEEALKNQPGIYFGLRFVDNHSVILRILSMVPVEEMMKHPVEWARAALVDSASADHWYMFEKDWGDFE